MKKVVAGLLFIVIMIFPLNFPSQCTVNYLTEAEKLKSLGLFKGTDNGFELDRAPTRVEASVMLIRLLGKEQTALEGTFKHPFTDVQDWADPYIGYMYENGLTQGIGNNLFGSSQKATVDAYMTFILRALGFNDSVGDFKWDQALEKIVSLGMIDQSEKDSLRNKNFLRGEMAHLSYLSLSQEIKNSTYTLADKLIQDGVFTTGSAEAAGIDFDPTNNPYNFGVASAKESSFIFQDPQKMFIQRDTLPIEVQGYKKVAILNAPKGNDIITKFTLLYECFFYNTNSNWFTPADDLNGYQVNYYSQSPTLQLIFLDELDKIIAVSAVEYLKTGNQKAMVYPCKSAADFEKPEDFQEKYDYYRLLPQLTTGTKFVLDGYNANLIADVKQLKAAFSNATYIGFGSTGNSSQELSICVDILYEDMKPFSFELKGSLVNITSGLPPDQRAIVILYDQNYKMIARSIVDRSQFAASDPLLFYIEGTVDKDANVTNVDFVLKRYINGVEDNLYMGYNYGTTYSEGDDFKTFRIGPLFKPDDGSITYTIESLQNYLHFTQSNY